MKKEQTVDSDAKAQAQEELKNITGEQEQSEMMATFNALKMLALAAEQYLKNQDELSRVFVGQQLESAVKLIENKLQQAFGV